MAKLGVVVSLVSAIILFMSTVSPAAGLEGMVGGRKKIKNVETNKEVQELGKFCVEEYNRLRRGSSSSEGGELMFSEVVEAETQIVSGIKYYLKIEANKGSETKVFDSVVVVKPWIHSRELIDFKPTSATH